MKVSLEERIHDIRTKLNTEKPFGTKLILLTQLLFLSFRHFVIAAFYYLFFPSQTSFQYFNTLNQETGYKKSYTSHRHRKHQMQATSLMMTLAIFGVMFVFNDYLAQFIPTRAAACNISSSTTIDSTYISTNSCDDITITADATLTFTEAIDLGGAGDYTFTVDPGVTATFDGALSLSDSGDAVVIDGVVTHAVADTTGVDITAGTITVSGTGSIDTDGLGCKGGETTSEDGYAPDLASAGVCTVTETGSGDGSAAQGTGGSYGGVGGYGTGQDVGAPYGPSLIPAYLGSGGGAGAENDGGDGGGLISLTATSTVTINGALTADGTDGTGSSEGSGGGSGGGIYISTDTLAGSGTIGAAGGNGGARTGGGTDADNDGSGGSGGKVAVHYNTSTFTASNVTADAGAAGGADNATDGDNGSVAQVDTDGDTLAITQGFQFADGEDYTRTSLTIGANADLNCDLYSSLTISTAGTLAFDGVDWECTTIDSLSLTADTITTANTNIFDFSKAGATVDWGVSNDLTLNNVTYTGGGAGTSSGTGGYWTIDDAVAVSLVNSTVTSNVQWTNLTDFSLDASSSISADSKGCTGATSYTDGYGPNTSTNVCTISTAGYSAKDNGTGGAAHGGGGGNGHTTSGGATYDSTTAPSLYGSGAGGTTNPVFSGGIGGGVVRIGSTSTIDIDGTISVDGGLGEGGASTRAGGGGSGGSLYLTTATLSGAGSLSAIGGDGGDRDSGTGSAGGGGGGGIVSVKYVTNTDFDLVSGVAVSGGSAGANPSNATNGSDGVSYSLQYTAPDQPSLSSPQNNSYNASVNATLSASTFSDNGSGHTSSDWKVTTDVGGSSIVWSATDDTSNLESITVNTTDGTFAGDLAGETALASNTQYYVFVRYTNAAGDSSWSSASAFTTTFTGTTSSQTWGFDTGTNYSFTDTYVDVASSIAQLVDLGSGSYATSGLSGWSKRKVVTADNSGGSAQTDFQVKVDVTYDADMQADFDDIRFTANDGTTELDYFLESYTASTSAVFWVEVPSVAADTTTTFLMQYGNGAVSTTSSGSDTFIFFDDFETFTGWSDYGTGTFSQSSDFAYQGTYSGIKDTANDPNGGTKAIGSTVGRDVMFEFFAYRDSGYSGGATTRLGIEDDSYNGYSLNVNHGGEVVQVDKRTAGAGSANNSTAIGDSLKDAWFIGQLEFDNSSVTARVLDTSYSSYASTSYSDTTTTSFTTVAIRGGYEYYLDLARIRKVASVTPSISTGSEQTIATTAQVAVTPSAAGDHPVVDELYGLSQTLGGSNAGTVSYQIGLDIDDDDSVDNWYYHDGSNWTTPSDDSTDVNTITEVNSFLPALVDDASIDSDQLFFKAFLISDATQAVELDSLVLAYNQLPLFAGTISNQSFAEDQEGTTALFDLDDFFSDSADETLTYSASNDLDSGIGTMIINGDGTVDITLAENGNGSDTVQLRATDQTGATVDSNEVTVTVSAVNDAPSLASISNKSVAENQQLQFSVSASDPESTPTLTVLDPSSHFANAGVTVSSLFTDVGNGTGTFTWTPTFEQAGTYALRVRASDGVATAVRNLTITVGNTDTDPSFSGTIGNIALESGQTVSNVFDLDTYFEDAEGELAYSVSGNTNVTVTIDDEGLVSVSAPSNYAGSEQVVFSATDIDDNVVQSDPVVITVTSSDADDEDEDDTAPIQRDDIGGMKGSLKGPGMVEIRDKEGNVLSTWRAFKKGGAVPRFASAAGQQYVFVTKAQSGSAIKAYSLDGELIGRKRLKLHWRRVTVGNLNKNKRNDEVVAFIRKNKRIKMKVYLFRPNKKKVFQLKKRATFRGLSKKGASVEIRGRTVIVRNKKGNVRFRWRPFGA